MKEFKTFLQEFEKNIPPEDFDYYKNVTRPVYNQLMDEIETRFKLLDIVMQNSVAENLQSLLVTGYVDINDYTNVKNVEPVININKTVNDVIKREDGALEIHLRSGRNNYLFSFICDCLYDEYIQMDNSRVVAGISLGNKKYEKELVYYNNKQYIKKESEIKKLFTSNRPQSSYFEFPLCRRIIDVYSVEKLEAGTEIVLWIYNLPGKIGIPVWNIVSNGNLCNGSSKNNHPDKKVILPYGLSGEKNQYSISFENCPENMLDGAVEIKNYACGYMFSQYDRKEKVLKLYTHDKKVWEEKFSLHQIMDIGEDMAYLWDVKSYSCLQDFVKKVRVQKNPTRAGITYYINIFADITGLKLKDMYISDDSRDIKLEFVVTDEHCMAMIEEYKIFLIEQLNEVFLGHRFEGQVVQYG